MLWLWRLRVWLSLGLWSPEISQWSWLGWILTWLLSPIVLWENKSYIFFWKPLSFIQFPRESSVQFQMIRNPLHPQSIIVISFPLLRNPPLLATTHPGVSLCRTHHRDQMPLASPTTEHLNCKCQHSNCSSSCQIYF